MNDFLNLSLIIISLILVAYLLIRFIKDYNNENIKDERTKRAIDYALEVVKIAVNATNQTFVKGLKENKGFDKDAMEDAFNVTKKAIIDMLDDKTLDILSNEFRDADLFLNNAIESKIWEINNNLDSKDV